VDDWSSIYNGSLANAIKFFGSSTAEIVSQTLGNGGGWNGDAAQAVVSSRSWFIRSSSAHEWPGMFTFHNLAGVAYQISGHRTILSGY
jgi:hypothetical protein